MAIMSRLVRIAAVATALLLPAGVGAGPDSAWTEGFHSRVRLVSGGTDQGRRLAGVEIKLDPGFKTYWRNPGESGLPPRFDWAASRNVAAVELEWPAPERLEDAGGVSHGYHDRVLIPVRITAKDPARPVTLALAVDYGVCKEICIPAHADLSLPLSDATTHRPLIEAALHTVPAKRALGAPDGLAVLAVEPVAGDKAGFAVAVRSPAGADSALFAEGPDGWYLSSSAAQPGGRFLITIHEKPNDAGPVSVRLTLTAGGQAVETDVHLDAGSPPR